MDIITIDLEIGELSTSVNNWCRIYHFQHWLWIYR